MVKKSENGKREANEKKVGIAERQQPPQERQQRSQDDLSQLGSSSSSYSVDGDWESDLNQASHAASSNPSVSSNQQRLDSAATSVARDAVALGAAIAIVDNASKEAAANYNNNDDHSRANGREGNERKKKKKNINDNDDNSENDGWRKVETKFADEKSISSLTAGSVFGQTEKPKRGDDYDGRQNKNKASDGAEAKDGLKSKNSSRVCTTYTPSVTGKSEEGLKKGDEKENEKETDDNSKAKKPETNENNQENEVKRKKKVEPQKQPPTTRSQPTSQPASRPPSQPESRPTSRLTSRPTSRPGSKSVSEAASPPKSKNVSIAGRNSAPAAASSARTSGVGSQPGYSSTAGSICTRYTKSKSEAEPEVTQPLTSKNVSIAGDTPRYAPTQSQGSKGGSICTRFSVQTKSEPSTEANHAAVDDASKASKASEGCDKERCSVYTIPKTPPPPPPPSSLPPPKRASRLHDNDNDKIKAVEGGEVCTDFTEKHVRTDSDEETVCDVRSMESFQTDDEGSSTTTLLLSGLGLVGLLALLSRFLVGGKAPCIAGRHGLPLKVMNISSECQMPVKLTATNCHLGLLNINAAKPDCSR